MTTIAREEVLKEISRLHDVFLTDQGRKEGVTDYVMWLVMWEKAQVSTARGRGGSEIPRRAACLPADKGGD